MALYDSNNNRLLDTNDNVLEARAAGTIGTSTIKKQFIGDQEVKAIYIGDVLVYEKVMTLPQLEAPSIWINGNILEIQDIEHAEFYDIYADGTYIDSLGINSQLVSYNISGGVLHNSEDESSLPQTIENNGEILLSILPNSTNYVSTANILVTNASYEFVLDPTDSNDDIIYGLFLRVYNPTGHVTVNITCPLKASATSYPITFVEDGATIYIDDHGNTRNVIYEHEIIQVGISFDYPESGGYGITGAMYIDGFSLEDLAIYNPIGPVTIDASSTEPEIPSYNISFSWTHGDITDLEESGDPLPEEINTEEIIAIRLLPEFGYYLSEEGVTVTNADYWFGVNDDPTSASYGELILFIDTPTDDVTVNIAFAAKSGATSYTISSGTFVNCDLAAPQQIYENEIAVACVFGDDATYIPDSITVSNTVDNEMSDTIYDYYTNDRNEVYIILSNPTGNVVIDSEWIEEPQEEEEEPEEEEEE